MRRIKTTKKRLENPDKWIWLNIEYNDQIRDGRLVDHRRLNKDRSQSRAMRWWYSKKLIRQNGKGIDTLVWTPWK